MKSYDEMGRDELQAEAERLLLKSEGDFATITRLEREVAELREALERIASWSEGPEVTGSFDEPESAKIARAALGSERPAERYGQSCPHVAGCPVCDEGQRERDGQ